MNELRKSGTWMQVLEDRFRSREHKKHEKNVGRANTPSIGAIPE